MEGPGVDVRLVSDMSKIHGGYMSDMSSMCPGWDFWLLNTRIQADYVWDISWNV